MALKLAWEKWSTKAATSAPLVICHGLFGSKQNWRSLARAFNTRLSRDIYAIDLRNHGDSPHNATHTFDAMAEDIRLFCTEHGLERPVLLGHSMGGKAVMAAALKYPSMVSQLVVVDMPPVQLPLAHSFAKYAKGMRYVEEARPSRLAEANKILADFEPNEGIRQFLLTNLRRDSDNQLRFRVPYDLLTNSLPDIASFDVKGSYKGSTMFITGGNSPYHQPFVDNKDAIRSMFPHSMLETVDDAGHWVHADKPEAFLNLVTQFLNNQH
ncbi:hypothetical protein LRAMOSA02512 [Lichtheimia ramosa]|uniref:AB hydrolase-1 domain-containing protein n=1 Tax=Lichtheimia ramosa TaxID=688394 RepID=A0A077WR32_9FUNG|nr:hypothetical protein LRAMOSA02512 [Lichtheimia ramosa]